MDLIIASFKDIATTYGAIWNAFTAVWYIVLPVALYLLFMDLWMYEVNVLRFRASIEHVILEIIAPKDIEKSPKSIESLYLGMSGVLKGNSAKEEYIQGLGTHRFSLELVSTEGTVHFYIRTPKSFRSLVEGHLYAQYPDVEIVEVSDYTRDIPAVIPNRDWDLWGVDLEMTQDPAYPIRTYKHFQEDVTGKMIDPLANLVETMGRLGPGQHLWFQQIIIPEPEKWNVTRGKETVMKLTGKAQKKEGVFERVLQDFKDVFTNIWAGLWGKVEFPAKEKKEEQPLEFRLSPGEKAVLKAVEENIAKNVFNVKMRYLVLGRRENFDKSYVSAFMGGIKQFSDHNLNGFKPNDETKTYANYVMTKHRLRYRQRKIFRRYRDRDPSGPLCLLSTEELATTFHLLDMGVVTPAVQRVEAKRGTAPANLPIG